MPRDRCGHRCSPSNTRTTWRRAPYRSGARRGVPTTHTPRRAAVTGYGFRESFCLSKVGIVTCAKLWCCRVRDLADTRGASSESVPSSRRLRCPRRHRLGPRVTRHCPAPAPRRRRKPTRIVSVTKRSDGDARANTITLDPSDPRPNSSTLVRRLALRGLLLEFWVILLFTRIV